MPAQTNGASGHDWQPLNDISYTSRIGLSLFSFMLWPITLFVLGHRVYTYALHTVMRCISCAVGVCVLLMRDCSAFAGTRAAFG